MSKKGLISSLVLGALLTLSLGVYTLVVAIIAFTTPHHVIKNVAYTSEQRISFANYSEAEGNLRLEFTDDKSIIAYDAEAKNYTVNVDAFAEDATVGSTLSFKAVATTDKHGSTTTYNVTVYKQGTGIDAENPHIVANKDNLLFVEQQSKEAANEVVASNYVLNVVEDIDLAGINWKGIASVADKFKGTVNGNGKTIKNMSINIDASNYETYLETLEVGGNNGATEKLLAVGLFNSTSQATIKDLSLQNASITISDDVYALVTNESENAVSWIRAGLLIGDARNTTIEGNSETSNVISGTIKGFSATNSNIVNGLGGVCGTILDVNNAGINDTTSISNYNVKATINSLATAKTQYVGGIAGTIVGINNNVKASITNCEVDLKASSYYYNGSWIGGVVGSAQYLDLSKVVATLNTKDSSITQSNFVALINGADFDSSKLSNVAGIAASLKNGTADNVTSNVAIQVFAEGSGAFGVVEGSTLSNVYASGKIVAYTASGLIDQMTNSTAEYVVEAIEAEEAPSIVAVSVELSGWYNAGFANRMKNSSVTSTGDVLVRSVIYAKGGIKDIININNTSYAAGLVGYMYATDAQINGYAIDGLTVETTIYDGVDMAGLVCYMNGKSDGIVSINNCKVTATIASQSYNNSSSTHKVAGAVDTIYGNATLDTVVTTINFNQSRTTGNKYGAAMFGGLVARIGGTNVTINNSETNGDAYINDSLYSKRYDISSSGIADIKEYKQITAGGLIGSIASFGVAVEAGTHPTTTVDGTKITKDDITLLDTTTIIITNNTSNVNLVIDYKETARMNIAGYRARSVGAFIGLIMNGSAENSVTSIDLSTNNYSGTVTADRLTFTYQGGNAAVLSSMGYGVIASDAAYDSEPIAIGSSYGFTSYNNNDQVQLPTQVVEEEPVEPTNPEEPVLPV